MSLAASITRCHTVTKEGYGYHAWSFGREAVSVLPMETCDKVSSVPLGVSLFPSDEALRSIPSLTSILESAQTARILFVCIIVTCARTSASLPTFRIVSSSI